MDYRKSLRLDISAALSSSQLIVLRILVPSLLLLDRRELRLTSTGSAQVRALVHLGANACIIGRNTSKTETVAAEIATIRPGSKVIGIGGVDVRRIADLEAAVARCVAELGGIDYVMYVCWHSWRCCGDGSVVRRLGSNEVRG